MAVLIDILRNKETINSGIITIIDQAIVSVTGFVMGIIVARTCDKTEFGLFVLGLTILTFALSLQSSVISFFCLRGRSCQV